MELVRGIVLLLLIGYFVFGVIRILAASVDKIPIERKDASPASEHGRRKSTRQIRAEAHQRREIAYKERTLKRVEKAPGAHLYVSAKEADAIRKSGILEGARFDTHVHK